MATYKEYQDEGFELYAPCDTCFPGVHPMNRAIYDHYEECRDQLIVGPDGPFAINVGSVTSILEQHGYDREEILDLRIGIQNLSRIELSEIRRRRK